MQVLGNTVKQAGSLVHPDYLRFDFTYHQNVTPEQIKEIEALVNQKIMADIPVHVEQMSMKEAIDQGALAFFGDKYNPEKVRMVKVDDFSIELCGGTHVHATGVIGLLKIIEIAALSAGHKRIVAVTGPKALELFQETYGITKQLCQEYAIQQDEVVHTVLKQKEQFKTLQTEVSQLKRAVIFSHMHTWEQQTSIINGIPFLALELEEADAQVLREIHTHLTQKHPGFYFTIAKNNGNATFLATLSDNYKDRASMVNFASWLKEAHALRGGGKPGSLQGGGGKFDAHLIPSIKEWFTKNSN
jgi:alanyl-tRNA synthetase